MDPDSNNVDRLRSADNDVGISDGGSTKKKGGWSLLRRRKDGKLRFSRKRKNLSPLAATYLSEDQTAAVLVVSDDDSSSVSAENGNPHERREEAKHSKNLAVILEEEEDRDGRKFESDVEENRQSPGSSLASVVVTTSTEPETLGHTPSGTNEVKNAVQSSMLNEESASAPEALLGCDGFPPRTEQRGDCDENDHFGAEKDNGKIVTPCRLEHTILNKATQDSLQTSGEGIVYVGSGSDISSSPTLWSPSDYVQELNAEESDTTASLSSWRLQAFRDHQDESHENSTGVPNSPLQVKRQLWPNESQDHANRRSEVLPFNNSRKPGDLLSVKNSDARSVSMSNDDIRRSETRARLPHLLLENKSLKPSELSALNPWKEINCSL